MRPEEIRQMLSQLVQVIQQTIASGEGLTDEFQGQLAETLNNLMHKLVQAEEQEGPAQAMQPPSYPQGADLIWILSGGDVNAFVNYLRTFPGKGFDQLASNPNALNQLIQHFQKTNPIAPAGQGEDGIPNAQLASSNVSGMKYDPRSQKLWVRFHGENGEPVYQYDGVPENIAQIIYHGNAAAKTKGKNRWGEWWPMKNPSLGAAVNQYLVNGGFQYQRIR
jgi:hypothetical protein